jgi:CRISPR/Cas system CSM-associated protein Csm2 small subunit
MMMNKTEALKMLKNISETKKYLYKMEKNLLNSFDFSWKELLAAGWKMRAGLAYQKEKRCSLKEALNFINNF